MASDSTAAPLTRTQWLICSIAAIGFAFDIYELLMLPLILRPALQELVGAAPGSPEFSMWLGRLFYVPAFVGGICGMLGGYLTDRLGRRRVLTWSILLYAVSAFLAGFSTNIWALLFFRCTTFIGVCVEFVAAVAWLAELFSDPHQREKVLGYTQAFSSIGGLLVAVANGLAVAYSASWVAIQIPGFLEGVCGQIHPLNQHAAWRYTLMSGLIPAIPLIVIRPFLPESPKWAEKKAAGTLRRASFAELFSPELRQTTIVTAVMFTCSYGAAFGAIQMAPQIVPGLPEVRHEVEEALASEATQEKIAKRLASDDVAKLLAGKSEEEAKKIRAIEKKKAERSVVGPIEQEAISHVTKVQEVGGLLGRVILAVLAVVIVSRRQLLRMFLFPGIVLMPIVFAWAATTSINYLYVGIFLAGMVTVGQFSFWGNYLPTVYPMHLRGTGESFAANIGGRLFGTSFAWVTGTIATMPFVPDGGATDPVIASATKFAFTAAGVATFVYLAAIIASFWLPEPKKEFMEE